LFSIGKFKVTVFELFTGLFVLQFSLVYLLLKQLRCVLQVCDLICSDDDRLIQRVYLLLLVKNLQLSFGVLFIQCIDLLLLIFDRFIIIGSLLLLVAGGLLQFLLKKVKFLFKLESSLGDFIVFVGLSLYELLLLSFLILKREFLGR
jgi:hypothetical protein